MASRDELEEQARQQADVLLDYLVQRRCWDLAREGDPTWEMAGSEAETLINAAWRCMATIAGLSEQEDRRVQERREREERQRPPSDQPE